MMIKITSKRTTTQVDVNNEEGTNKPTLRRAGQSEDRDKSLSLIFHIPLSPNI